MMTNGGDEQQQLQQRQNEELKDQTMMDNPVNISSVKRE